MRTEAQGEHPTTQTLGDYVNDVLSEEQTLEIEQHLLDCTLCAKLTLSAHKFRVVWSHLTAESYGAAYRRYQERQQARVVAEAEPEKAGLSDQIRNWREKWKGQAAAALRVIMDAREESTRLVTEGVEALLMPNPTWQFQYGVGGTRTRGTETHRPDQTIVVAHEDPRVQVIVEHQDRRIVIKVPVSGPPESVPQALLVNEETGMEIVGLRQPLQPRARFCLITFENAPLGNHTIVFRHA